MNAASPVGLHPRTHTHIHTRRERERERESRDVWVSHKPWHSDRGLWREREERGLSISLWHSGSRGREQRIFAGYIPLC